MDKATGNHIRSLSDADLLRYSNAGTESRPPEALAFAREELSRRNLSSERLAEADAQTRVTTTPLQTTATKPPSFSERDLRIWRVHRLQIAAWLVAGLSMAALGDFACLGLSFRLSMTYTQVEWFVVITCCLMLASVFCGTLLWRGAMPKRDLTHRFWRRLARGLLTAGIAAAITVVILFGYNMLLFLACFRH